MFTVVVSQFDARAQHLTTLQLELFITYLRFGSKT